MSSSQSQTRVSNVNVNELGSQIGKLALRGSYEPLKRTGILDNKSIYDFKELTPTIGRQYNNIQIKDLLIDSNSNELIKELAIVVSERGVVFFKQQDLTIEQQTELGHRLGQLSGRPVESGLHIHPTERSSELPDQISTIDSSRRENYSKNKHYMSAFASKGWHTDITFEKVPSDFAMLKVHTLPETGGDTLWASAYELYDRLSPSFARFLEGLTATHDGNAFHAVAAAEGVKAFDGVRGHPLNVGSDFTAIHPVIRTNPITGWKGVFVNGVFTKRINELSKDESDLVLNYLTKLVSQNHDLQVRHRWSKNDLAIWTNVSTLHSATFDYGREKRVGDRVVSLGERPYFDPASKSRREALGQKVIV
ncbi:hypothetical protein OIO90_005958 [Microbotryomycetes sp. JL221]|nr:hypothetical protein OIO90_005958 [Microbotryomycetes sp. JL221]